MRLDHFLVERGSGQPLDTQDALSLLRQIAEAVRFAHGKRLYYRALSHLSGLLQEDAGAYRALELAQGALLGSPRLSVAEVQDRIQGRYPQALPLPGRPQLDALLQDLELGLVWEPVHHDIFADRSRHPSKQPRIRLE